MTDENKDHDTSTDDQIGDLELEEHAEVKEEIPVAAETAAAEPAPAPPAGPRVFPQHYNLLFGAVMIFVASISVWQRKHIFGATVSGPEMISGTFLMAMAMYCIIVGILNIVQGRLRGMMAAFVTGVASLYLSIKAFLVTFDQPLHLGFGEIGDYVGEKVVPARAPFDTNPDLFPKEILDAMTDQKEAWAYWAGQWAPGVWWGMIGGALIVLVFLRAFFPAKKAEPAPAPRRRRR